MKKVLTLTVLAVMLSGCQLLGNLFGDNEPEDPKDAPEFDIHEIVTSIDGGEYIIHVKCESKFSVQIFDGWYQGVYVGYGEYDKEKGLRHVGDKEYKLTISPGVDLGNSRLIVSNEYGRDFLTFYRQSSGNKLSFTVSDSTQVAFAPGNLQYNPGIDKWRFAPLPYEYLAEANNNRSTTEDHWIDMFCWGTGDCPMEILLKKRDFVDWGINAIGDDAPNTWRTLTENEWLYLFHSRPNADYLRGGFRYKGVEGTIVLPDGCVPPAESNYSPPPIFQTSIVPEYTDAQWEALMTTGALILPHANKCFFGEYSNEGCYSGGSRLDQGAYWTSTYRSQGQGIISLVLVRYLIDSDFNDGISTGLSVRLAKTITE